MSNITLQIRPDDCDASGRINNGVYINYVQYAFAQTLIQLGFAQDWMDENDILWQLKTATIEYRQAAVFGDVLHASLWLDHADPNYPKFGCEIIKSDFSGQHAVQAVARTQTEWQRISRKTGKIAPLHENALAYFPQTKGALPRPFELPANGGSAKEYTWEHKVMRSEVGTGNHARSQAIYAWLEEAMFEATAEAGWTPARRRKAGCNIFQVRHDTEFFLYPEAGDSLYINSRLMNVRKNRGIWLQEVLLCPQQTLCVLDYSTDIFVDPHGHPSPPPPEMIQDLQFPA